MLPEMVDEWFIGCIAELRAVAKLDMESFEADVVGDSTPVLSGLGLPFFVLEAGAPLVVGSGFELVVPGVAVRGSALLV